MNGKVFQWLCLVLFVVSCTPQVETGAGGEAPRVGKIVPEGEPIRIDLRPTTERVPNCSGSTATVSKSPTSMVVTGHSVEWEVGGEAGVGMTIGEGVIPFGVDLRGALTGSTGESIVQEISQSSSWTLPAAPGEIIEYTLVWWELWQPGYIDVTLADQSVIRVNVKYRSGIQSDIVNQIAYDCDGNLLGTAEPITPQPAAPTTIPSLLPVPTITAVPTEALVTPPAPTVATFGFTREDADQVQLTADCNYWTPNMSLFEGGVTNKNDYFTWDLTVLPAGYIVGNAVEAEIDGISLGTNGVTFLIERPDPQSRQSIKIRDGVFFIVAPENAEGVLRLRERNLQCLGNNQGTVRYP